MTINEITANLNNIEITTIIRRVLQGVTNNNSPYLNLLLQDQTGTISTRMWDVKPADIEKLIVGCVIKVNANSIVYNNEIQLKLNSYEIVVDNNLSDQLVAVSPIDVKSEWKYLINCVKNFQDQTLKQIILHLLKTNEIEFVVRPAAVKMHHSSRSGLLWHTITMLKTAEAIVKIYSDRNINQDLLFAGIILHDFGKLWELSPDVISKFTVKGQLIGHIVLGSEQVALACQELKIDEQLEIVILLQHLILASHGKHEFGSPVLPKTLEAEILHQIDNLDAKITLIDEALKETKIGEVTKRLPAAENRLFLKHFKEQENKS